MKENKEEKCKSKMYEQEQEKSGNVGKVEKRVEANA